MAPMAHSSSSSSSRKQAYFGEQLVVRGLITRPILEYALEKQRSSGKRLGEVLVEGFYLSEIQLACLLAEHFKLEFVDVAELALTPELLNLIPESMARKHMVLPLGKSGKTLDVVMVDPGDLEGLSDLAFASGAKIAPRIGTRSQILEAIDRFYARHMEIGRAHV